MVGEKNTVINIETLMAKMMLRFAYVQDKNYNKPQNHTILKQACNKCYSLFINTF